MKKLFYDRKIHFCTIFNHKFIHLTKSGTTASNKERKQKRISYGAMKAITNF